MNNLNWYFKIAFLLYWLLPNRALAQYHAMEIQLPENLHQKAIYCQTQLSNGFMLFGTSAGLYQYDGWRFEAVASDSSLSLDVTAIYEDDEHRVWIGTDQGEIGQMEAMIGGTIVPWEVEEGHPHVRITGITKDNTGILWFSTYGEGIYAWTGSRLFNFDEDDGLPANEIYQMVKSPEEGVWAGSDLGMIHCSFSSNHKWVRTLSTGLGLPDHIIPAVQNAGDRIWFGTYDEGIGWVDALGQTIAHSTPVWFGGSIASLYFWDKDRGFIGTASNGLWEMHGKQIRPVQFSPKLTGKAAINQLLMDQEGVMWMIVNEQYLYTFLPAMQRWDHHLGEIQSLAYLNKDSLCLGRVDGLTLAKINPSGGLQILKQVLPGSNVISLFADKDRYLYAGTFGQGVYVLDPMLKVIAHWDEASGLLNGSILSIIRQDQYLWLATLAGVSRIQFAPSRNNSVEIRNFTKSDGLPSNYIYQVRTDHRGRLWIATDGAGVSVFEKDQFKQFPTAFFSGSHGQDTIQIGNVYSMAEDTSGRLWMNTANQGVLGLRMDDNQFERIDPSHGLRTGEISILAWSGAHLIMVDRDGVEAYHPGTASLSYYEESVGMNDMVLNINAAWSDREQGVWFASNQSLYHFQEMPATSFQPVPVIREVQIIDQGLAVHNYDHIRYDQNHLRISYAGIWNTQPENISFSYRVIGSDSTWRRTRDHQAFLLNLDPGTYTFQLRASVHGDFTHGSQADYHFTIGKPFWLTWWFITLLTVLTFMLLLGVIKWREYVVNQRSAMEKNQIKAELATIKNQINPHFLFNSFNTLAATIEEDRDTAIEYVEHLSDFYRKILLYGDATRISLGEELKIVDEFCSILKFRYGEHLIIDLKPMHQDGDVVPMSLQRLIENAIKHNEISRLKPLTITIYNKHDYVGVSNPIQLKWTKEASTGFGLESIRKQYQVLTNKPVHIEKSDGRFTVEIPILIKE